MIRCLVLSGALALAACGSTEEPAAAPSESGAPTMAAPASTAPATPANSSSPSKVTTIPAAFHGTWDTTDAPCDPVTDGRLTIAADTLMFYESQGKVTEITVESPTRISVSAAMSGEGESWPAGFRFELREGGEILSADDMEEPAASPFLRKRCS